jgi:hypothetical protein
VEPRPLAGDGGRVSGNRRFRLAIPRRGDPRASVAAFVVQLALMAIVVPALVVPVAFELLRDDSGRVVTPERITFITTVPESGPPTTEAPRAGGDGREVSPEPTPEPAPVAPIVAPVGTPTELPPVPERPVDPERGVGPLVGGGGPTLGIRPSFNDPRLWRSPGDEVTGPVLPMTRADSLRELLHANAVAFVDSVNRAEGPPQRAPGDWTFERNGKKYGIDPRFIRLGKFSIPTAVLALLPMNGVQGNPTATERAQRLSSMRVEIMDQAARMQREDEFRQAVKALRERKERERREAAEKARIPDPVVPAPRP